MKLDPEEVQGALRPGASRDDAVLRALRNLPRRMPPAALGTSLRVLASRERSNVYGRGIVFMDRARMLFENLMRPLALPFAGGVFSAIVMFSMWLSPTYRMPASTALDVPTVLTTAAAVKQAAPISATAGDVVVDIVVDGDGRMIDYRIVSGGGPNDAALRRNIEGFLLLTQFTPATAFGRPVEGRLRISLRSSHIDVKG